MFVIDQSIIEDTVAEACFACDLVQCRGACCTLPGRRGAPLLDSERAELHAALPVVGKYLPERHRAVIETAGPYEGTEGDFATTCVDDRECVFVCYEDGTARCAIEKAYRNGELAWPKPLSCHLFPIRISNYCGERLRYERIDPCRPAVEHGQRENVLLSDFVMDALVRKYGTQWYDAFREECLRLRAEASQPGHFLRSLFKTG